MSFFLSLLLFVLYFLPSLRAIQTKRRDKWSIVGFNLLLGWTGVCWLIAMFWAYGKEKNV